MGVRGCNRGFGPLQARAQRHSFRKKRFQKRCVRWFWRRVLASASPQEAVNLIINADAIGVLFK
jgi:hypothetical protein